MNGRQLVEWILHEASVPSVDDVCTMVGRSRGECWGCPITKCPRQVTPFEVELMDSDVIAKAIQKLKTNQIWVGSTSGRLVMEALVDMASDLDCPGGVPGLLLYLLVDSREQFLLNQAVESAVVGNQSIEEAAASVRYLGNDTKQDKNIHKFRRLVAQRVR